ncbi:MAG: LysR substrate-binding domain-containing protein [Pseudomonadota bacterium]
MEDIKPIRVFLEVAAELSFSRAAQSLKMTAASVTRIVAKLEEDLGQQLLVRTTRQVSLTSAGAVVAARMKPIVEEFDRTAHELASAARPDRGRLRINAPLSMGVRLLPGLADSFRLAYPNIALDIRLTDRMIDVIEEDCDLAIRISKPPTDKSTIWRKICRVPRHAIAAPGLFTRIPMPERPDDIDPKTALSYSSDGSGEMWEFSAGAQSRTLRAGTDITSNNGDFLYELAKAGAGICVLPDFIVSRGIARGDVIRILPDWDVSNLWLTLYYPPYEQLPPLVATFTDFFESYMRDLDGLIFD